MTNKPDMTWEIALDRLRANCSQSEKSKYYIKTKLRQWGVENFADKIIDQLENEKFIDESRFASAFARDKSRFQKWGKKKIQYQLGGMQIPENIISEALLEIDQEAYQEMVRSELEKKIKLIHSTDKYEIKQKLFQFATQRGYEADLIYGILEKMDQR